MFHEAIQKIKVTRSFMDRGVNYIYITLCDGAF